MKDCVAWLGVVAVACTVLAASPVAVAPPLDNRRLVLKPGAPEPVRVWFAWLAFAKQDEVERRQQRLGRTLIQLDSARAELRHLSTSPVPTISAGRDNFGQEIRRRDEHAIQQRQDRVRELRKLIPRLIEDMRQQERSLAEFQADPVFIAIPEWSPRQPKLLGRVGATRVVQIVGPASMLIRAGNDIFFLDGVPTDGLADGDLINSSATVVSTGTRSYWAVDGSKRTAHVLEFIDPLVWVEVVSDPPATP